MLGLFGAVIGAALGIGLTYLLVHLFARAIFGIDAGFSVDWPIVAVSAVAGISGVLAIAWPTLGRALRTPVHDALVSEGLVSGFGAGRLDRAVMHSGALPTARPPWGTQRGPTERAQRHDNRADRPRGRDSPRPAVARPGRVRGDRPVLECPQLRHHPVRPARRPSATTPPSCAPCRSQPGVAGVEAATVSQMTYRGQTLYAFGVHASTFIAEPLTAGHWLTPRRCAQGCSGHDRRIGSRPVVGACTPAPR